MTPSEALLAMLDRYMVISDDFIEGYVDEIYRSIHDGRIRARICDWQGRVHHYHVDQLSYAQVTKG